MSTLEEILRARRQKLEKLLSLGIDPFPEKSSRSLEIASALKNFRSLSRTKKKITLAGRLVGFRYHGGAVFGDLRDASAKIQLLFKKDLLGDKFDLLTYFDLGDFLEAEGVLFKTKAGEETLEVRDFKLLAKSLRPLPSEWYGLEDVEERFRKRYLDLLANEEVYKRFLIRSQAINFLRQYLEEKGFIEFETPILQTLYGGAAAKPFKTYLDILRLDLFLRIAPELYLKRLLVGGFEKIYEIGRVFRNEGVDREHNPEFTMLELYWAYQDREGMMKFWEELLSELFSKFNPQKSKTAFSYQGKSFSLKQPWVRIGFAELLRQEVSLDYDSASAEDFRRAGETLGLEFDRGLSKGKIADEIFKKLALQKIVDPTFVIDHPTEISPLAKRRGDTTARFQLVIAGWEILNGFSELNDPIDQRKRLEEQEKTRRQGDEEAHRLDEDFLEALEYGMPPAAGIGVGVDRLVALLTDAPSLKEVIFFPLMKPK